MARKSVRVSSVVVYRTSSQLSIKRNFILDPSKLGEKSPISFSPIAFANRVLLINRMIQHFEIFEI